MPQRDFEIGVSLGQALSDIRHLQHRDERHETRLDDHHMRITRLERRRKTQPGRGQRAALVTALWTAAAGTAWHADSIAARLIGLIGR